MPPHVILNLETGAGDVAMTSMQGNCSVRTSAGDVRGSALATPYLTVDTSAGDVNVDLDAVPTRVSITTGAGDVGLAVPSGTYGVSVTTSAGNRSVTGLRDDSAASSRLVVRTYAGDIAIRGR
jgi:DUF4097 and DUF4098 domain-containing protein YvlB